MYSVPVNCMHWTSPHNLCKRASELTLVLILGSAFQERHNWGFYVVFLEVPLSSWRNPLNLIRAVNKACDGCVLDLETMLPGSILIAVSCFGSLPSGYILLWGQLTGWRAYHLPTQHAPDFLSPLYSFSILFKNQTLHLWARLFHVAPYHMCLPVASSSPNLLTPLPEFSKSISAFPDYQRYILPLQDTGTNLPTSCCFPHHPPLSFKITFFQVSLTTAPTSGFLL